jgi:hypothetical protein
VRRFRHKQIQENIPAKEEIQDDMQIFPHIFEEESIKYGVLSKLNFIMK